MFRANNFISFHDLSPEIPFLWASPSIYDVLGYEPEEIIGMNAADMIYPDDITNSNDALKENIKNDLVASQLVNKLRRKDGRPAHLLHVFSTCYDFLVNCSTLLDPAAFAYQTLRAHSSAMTRIVGSKQEEYNRMKRHLEAFAANYASNYWNSKVLEPEPRVCVILNRFTRNFVVMYASSGCEAVFQVDPDDFTGKPFLLFIRVDDLAPFVEQMDIVKGSTAIVSMRFWFQSPNCRREIPCEAIFMGAADGVLTVIRRCKPFIRKQFIESRERYEATHNSSWSSSVYSRSSEYSRSYESGRSYGSVQSRESSPISSAPTESTPSSYDEYGFATRNPGHNISRSGLNRIKIFELKDDNARPITGIPEDDPNLVKDSTVASMIPAFKELIIQDYSYDEDDTETNEAILTGMMINTNHYSDFDVDEDGHKDGYEDGYDDGYEYEIEDM
ncbi:hypothetical protein BGX27_007551 [Mortierella sp. AM989]|nr:hypothetical protein BGX27_007551 [Mortierella sp. AM989]